MFLLDTLLVSGLRWTLDTIRTAADRELDDDTALRQRLLEAEMRRELGEISEEEFRAIESDVVTRLRVIRERRGGAHALAFEPADRAAREGFTVEATLEGDFHEPAAPGDVAPAPAAASRRRVTKTRSADAARRRASPRGGRSRR